MKAVKTNVIFEKKTNKKGLLIQFRLFIFYKTACLQRFFHGRVFFRGRVLWADSRELKHQTFSTGRRQPEVKFTSDSRFPPTGSAVATLRTLCFAYFDVSCKTWVSLLWFSHFYNILPPNFGTKEYLKYYFIVLAFVRAIVKYLQSFSELFSL